MDYIERFEEYVRAMNLTDADDDDTSPSSETFERAKIGLALHDTIVRNDLKGCSRLVRHGHIDLNRPLRFSYSSRRALEHRLVSRDILALPLHVACIYRRPQIVEILLAHGANPNMQDYLGRVPLQLVLAYWPRIQCESDTNKMNKEDRQYQVYLRQQHHKAKCTLEFLLNAGVDPRTRLGTRLETALHLAASYNIVESVAILCRHGAPLDVLDYDGRTPLIIAAKVGSAETLQQLLYFGAEVNIKDCHNLAAIHYATMTESPVYGPTLTALRLLCEYGADINMIGGGNQETGLHMSASVGNEQTVHFLLQHRANTEILNVSGQTPLYKFLNNSQNHGCIYGIELLLQSTLNLNVIDNEGNTPEMLNMFEFGLLQDYLLPSSGQPQSLQRICRFLIRKCLGLKRLNEHTVKKLPCAPGLQKLILFNIMHWQCRPFIDL